ncbi:MAG TPA: universal stress protein [Burkholderiales bacterium]|nr:universal stress protein [Burkholderiales bacterium]
MTAYRRILAAVDGSDASARGLREAIRLAKSEGAQLTLLHVVNDFYAYASLEGAGLDADVSASLRKDGQRLLARLAAQAAKGGVRTKTVLREVGAGPVADVILREAGKQRADLIVLGTHGRRGVRRLVVGSDAEQVVRTSRVPVLLVRGAG